ncbi:Uncharacterized protein TCAP_00005 [Tolypocladium capitatum]|uniref:Uncharacterized protein n=1 Tax=Tolypocladium capitatum TaxID=45235 RepID=A0A2K3QRE1_9HYPO|nr:Uncharacterized protein TCAP_00005 [Tolypocladium capitatum]
MAPAKRADETTAGGTPPHTGVGDNACLILTIVLAGVCALGIAAGLVSNWRRKRRQHREVAEKSSPAMSETLSKQTTSSTFSTLPSDDGDQDRDELQRQHIIRKSLASRVPSREATRPSSCEALCTALPNDTEERASAEPSIQDRDPGESVALLESPVGLVNDWKRWEARLRQDNARSLRHHPGVDQGLHPPHDHAAPVPPTAYLPARRPLMHPPATTACSSTWPDNLQTYRSCLPLSRTGEAEHV